jgi:putative ABC transport system permease protein
MLAPDGRAVGQRISVNSRPRPDDWMLIVGIVDDVRQQGPSQPFHAAIYRPYLQVTQPFFLDHLSFVVRTTGDPLSVAPHVRAAVGWRDRTLPADTVITMDEVLDNSISVWRFNARLLGSFAIVALILSVVGIYGLLTYSVMQRTHEIGVRMALGAKRTAVRWLVLRRTLTLCGLGIAIGIAGGVATTRILHNLLFEITPTDLPTFVGVAATILLAGLAAGYIPARRATRVDPLLALRHE